ncbi:cation diffusion facilitator family transporter [Clostridium psychrophilum]|uniref:cation diffusion facilitator family transporter n=1 Tax=Clostridium psychrophilum TaxID=132926 RepID=UPI001C0D5CA7|nr:cation diffusion facilitator family transporter [Clostridium psychrophilum]MBU3180054.1 cation diffusion facilitator family transporter [Clostridium psychrophilum]
MKSIFDFIIKKFVKNYSDVGSQVVRQSYGWLGGIVGFIINTTILILELIVGVFLNSISITADAVHNLTDAVSSLITILSFKLANRPADTKHPFGYGRVEYITSLLFSLSIFFVGYEFLRSSIGRVLQPVSIPFNMGSFLLMLLALPLQIFLNRFTKYIGIAINSSALKASALESFTDILVLSMVTSSLLITRFTTFPVDGYAGIIVSLFILHSGFALCKETLDYILGKAPDKQLVKNIYTQVLSYKYITGVHDLIIHNYGPGRYMVSLHAEVPCDIPVMQIHDVIDKIEKEVGEKLNLYLVIHMDPFKSNSPDVIYLKKRLNKELSIIKGIQSIHDFRVVGDVEAKTLIFDVVVDKSYYNEKSKINILMKIEAGVKNISSQYRCIVTMDKDYY